MTPRVWLTTLGCGKNQVDSDKLTAVLDEAGYSQARSSEEAGVVMINTCAFIEEPRRESIDYLQGIQSRITAAYETDLEAQALGVLQGA